MIQAKSIVKLNTIKIAELNQAAITALGLTGEALKAEIIQAQVIPFDKGTLQGDAFFVDYTQESSGRVSLVHSTPYARRLYYHPEYNFQTLENPYAKGHWFEDWLPGGKDEEFTKKAFKEFYKKAGGL